MHQDLGIGLKLAERTDAGRQIFATMPWKAISSKITEESRAEEMRVLYVAMTRAREKLILTGTIAENRMQNKAADWGRCVDGEELQLPTGFVRRAGSYLDWIVPAIARHPDGDVFCEFAGVTPSGGCQGDLSGKRSRMRIFPSDCSVRRRLDGRRSTGMMRIRC